MTTTSAWSFKNFRLYTYTALLLPFAAQTQSLVVGWQVYEIKHDPLYLGLIGLVEAIPALSLALIGGYVVDRSNPLKVYKAVLALAVLTAALLLVSANPWVPLSEIQRLPVLYLAAFLGGLGRGFRMPAVTSLIPQLVPREALHVSSAWNATAFSVAAAMGPALGGVLYAWKGALCPYSVNAVVLVFAYVMISRIRAEIRRNEFTKEGSVFDNLTAGVRYVFSNQLLLGAMTLDMLAVLFGGVVALLPIFAGEILKVGASGLGILSASDSIGALIGGFILIRFPVSKHSGRVLLAAVAGFGFCMIGFGLSKTFWISVALLALGGAFDSVSRVVRGAIVQLSAPPEMRGRVGAVNSIFIGVSNQLGEFESGVTARLFGTTPSVILGGGLTLVVVALTTLRAPRLREMDIEKL